MSKPVTALLLLVGLFHPRAEALAQVRLAGGIDADLRDEILDELATQLLDNYVFPDKADEMVAAIEASREAGEYEPISSGPDLARKLTEDLRAICHDLHLAIRYNDPAAPGPSDPTDPVRRGPPPTWNNYGFVKAERLPGNIGYLRFDQFSGAAEALETASAAMNFLADSDALLIDLRYNGGGDPGLVAWVSSYLFGDEPVHLNSLYFRPADETEEFWTNPDVPGRKRPDRDVYVLTSHYTFSAAEEFTYNLKCRERATIVGETTGGGAHPVNSFLLNERFTAIIPVGRAINPITKTNWEGTGIAPHRDVPANEALLNAHLMALKRSLERTEDALLQASLRAAMVEANRELADIELANEEQADATDHG